MIKNIIVSREQQLEELRSFTDAVNKEINEIVGTLGWTVESVTNVEKDYFTCPYDTSHLLTEGSLNDHLVSCKWKAEGYGKLDIPFSEPTLPADSPFSIKFDEQLQNEVLRKAKEQDPTIRTGMGERLIPHTSDKLLANFTSDERKAIYDYVIANTAKPDIGQDIADINNLKPQDKDNKELSFIELLMQERNLKRRRAKHKGVHTNKKSHVEVLREVISQQMEIYTDYISEQTNSEHIMDVQNAKMDDSNYETMQDRTEHLYQVFHDSPRDYDDSRESNGHHYNKRDDLKRECLEKRSYHRSRNRDKRERYSDEYNETYRKHRHSEDRKSPHSRDRKSHKKEKHRSRDRHKNKHHEKKHKSRDRDKSSERYHTKHSDHKRKEKSRDY